MEGMTEQAVRQSILIVDDTPDNVTVLDGILCNQYRVRFALNGDRALAIARSTSPPDLILLDVMMPGMDGYEVCRRLKADPLTRNIPVIFVTALNESVSEAFGLSLGAVDYLTKPINPDITLARRQNALSLVRYEPHAGRQGQ
jgi:putative two-component system response regulator